MRRGHTGIALGLAALLAWAAGFVPLSGRADPASRPDPFSRPDPSPRQARAAAAAEPKRIVSINLCTDQLLLDLVPRERIAGLSVLVADDTLSGRVEAAAGIPLLRGHAEEVLALAPDLVLAGTHSTRATVDLLKRLGVAVVEVPMAFDFAGIREAVRVVAGATGMAAAGEAAIARFDRRLAAAASATAASAAGAAPGAVVYQLNSLASGAGTLLDEIVRAAGYRNAALGMQLGPAGRLPLETLVLDAPDVVVMATEADTYRTRVADNLRHPAFRAVISERTTVSLPMPLWMCGTPDVATAVERLAAARSGIAARRDALQAVPQAVPQSAPKATQ